MPLNGNEYLEPGLHVYTFNGLVEDFVAAFSASHTRKEIIEDFRSFFISLKNQGYVLFEIWVDGSYVSSKVNPNDMDIVIFLSYDSSVRARSDWGNICLTSGKIDPYYEIWIEDAKQHMLQDEIWKLTNRRNYWKGQFGFDRNDNPKGIIKIDPNSIYRASGGEE